MSLPENPYFLFSHPRCVARGGQGAMAPQLWIEWIFLPKKTGFVGTVLSTRSVLRAWSMPKMRWRPRLGPGPRWESSRRSPRPSRLGRGHPLPNPYALGASILTPSRSSSVPPQCKILATPLSHPYFRDFQRTAAWAHWRWPSYLTWPTCVVPRPLLAAK